MKDLRDLKDLTGATATPSHSDRRKRRHARRVRWYAHVVWKVQACCRQNAIAFLDIQKLRNAGRFHGYRTCQAVSWILKFDIHKTAWHFAILWMFQKSQNLVVRDRATPCDHQLQGYLAHKKTPPPRTLQWAYVYCPTVVLRGGGVFL